MFWCICLLFWSIQHRSLQYFKSDYIDVKSRKHSRSSRLLNLNQSVEMSIMNPEYYENSYSFSYAASKTAVRYLSWDYENKLKDLPITLKTYAIKHGVSVGWIYAVAECTSSTILEQSVTTSNRSMKMQSVLTFVLTYEFIFEIFSTYKYVWETKTYRLQTSFQNKVNIRRINNIYQYYRISWKLSLLWSQNIPFNNSQ